MNVWPFMFAASKTSDYQFVVLPDIFDANSCAALRERLEIDDIDPHKTRTATVAIQQSGNMSCVYRAGPIVVDNTARTDTAGRKLLFAFGVVTRELPAGSSFARLSELIDASRPFFEKSLVSFLGSDREWKPVVKKAVKLPAELDDGEPGTRQFAMPGTSALLLLGLLVNLGICAGLYWKVSSLEKQLGALNSNPPKVDAPAGSAAAKSETSSEPVNVSPSPAVRAPEVELKKSGPLRIEQPRQ